MPAWWERAVIYEIYPRSFQDSDGDGIGDLAGVESRLDYLVALGVDAIWLTPIYPSPGADCGYDVSDHSAVAAEYGGEQAFDSLIAAAHERGIKVLLDVVASHTSIEHPWFREHPERYVWADGDGPPNNWIASFGGPAWSRDERSGRWYLHSFFPEQPDLDWRRADVREAMGEMISGWVARGVDGFRIDAVDRLVKDAGFRDDPPGREPFPLPVHPDQQSLDLIRSRDDREIGLALAALREAAGDVPLIGEVYLPGHRLARYLEHLDRVFAFDLLHAPWQAAALADVLDRAATEPGLAWVTSNHDFSRVATRWGPDAVRNAAMLLLTLPGCAFLYQGEELGMADGPGATARRSIASAAMPSATRCPGIRARPAASRPASPGCPRPGPPGGTAAEQLGDPGSVLSLFRGLIALRRELEGPVGAIAEDARPALVRARRPARDRAQPRRRAARRIRGSGRAGRCSRPAPARSRAGSSGASRPGPFRPSDEFVAGRHV